MGKVKAPFNFVPISGNVYIPGWGHLISQDIPFEDGLSGTIDIELKAETPLFIRNASNVKGEDEVHSCKMPDGRFMIPGTTLKGGIRNILSILSFGRIRVGKDIRFAQREWYNKKMYSLMEKKQFDSIRCGWLVLEKDRYVIKDCEKPFRIGMSEIDTYLGEDKMYNNFSIQSKVNLNNKVTIGGVDYDPKTAAYKYKLLEKANLDNIRFTILNSSNNRVKVDLKNGNIEGTIVLTGQPSLYKWPRPTTRDSSAGKFYEFVFQNKVIERIPVSDEMYRQYSLMYSESPDWIYWKKKGKGIPVFFRKEKEKLKDFGLAFLYKLPYDRTVKECANQANSERRDLADCIFGYTDGDDSLKGRVQFSAAFSDNALESEEIKLVLNSPKASYYPIYIRQKNISNEGKVPEYLTYNDGTISGYKRYVQRKSVWKKSLDGVPETIISKLIPLQPGSIFKGKIRFHNLKEIELGALLSALTFHNNANTCFHQFGQAKPYGFGRMSLQDIRLNIIRGEQYDKEYYMAIFEKELSDFVYGQWLNSEQIRELMALSSNIITEDKSSEFEYMSHDNTESDFVNAKKEKMTLKPYTHLTKSISVESLWDKYKDAYKVNLRIKQEKKRKEEEVLKIMKENEEKRIADEIKAKMAEELQQRINEKKAAGLSFLNEKVNGDSVKYKVSDFNGGYKRIEQWMKKTSVNVIGIEFENDLEEWLIRSYTLEKKQKIKDAWKDINNKDIWKKLEKLIDDADFLAKLYAKVIK